MAKVIVKKSGIQGKGLFASGLIKKGEVVNVWHPKKVVLKKELSHLSTYEMKYVEPWGKGKHAVMGIPERYVNHSCDPNTFVSRRRDVALHEIKKGEEITSDYSSLGTQDSFLCRCGKKNCRKHIS